MYVYAARLSPELYPHRKIGRKFANTLVFVLALLAQDTVADVDLDRNTAVTHARAGEFSTALDKLEGLHAKHPESMSVRLDLAVVSAWAGRDTRALSLLKALDTAEIPTYALAIYARSARNTGQWELSTRLYDRLIDRNPDAIEYRLGRTLVLADADRFDEARLSLAELRTLADQSDSAQAKAALACGYIEERSRRYTQSLGCYDQALKLDPDFDEARRRRILVASALGASVRARDEAQRFPQLLTTQEKVRLELDAAAMRIRWADLPNPDAPLADAKAAVSIHKNLLDRRKLYGESGAWFRTLEFDRVAALVTAYRMTDAIALFESLQSVPGNLDDFPVYVLSAAGEAYLYVERSDESVKCFDAAIVLAPGNFNLKVGLFYALSDNGDYARARMLATNLLEQEPAWERPTRSLWLPNPQHAAAKELAVMELAYREQYDEALQSLHEMLAIAPANGGLRLANAQLMHWRGWNDSAQRELSRIRLSDPDNVPATVLSGHVALDTQRFADVERALQQSLDTHPYDKSAQNLGKRWVLHNRAVVEIRTKSGRSDGGAFSSEDWQSESYYFSSPLAYRYRWFMHDLVSYGEFDEGIGRDHRLGAGVEYRDRRWTMRGEVHRGIEQNKDFGVAASLSWLQSDHLILEGSLAANTSHMPLRGIRLGVKANDIQLGATYRWHESRQASASFGVMDMDDGNRRDSLNLRYHQRMVNTPRHKLTANLRAYSSQNSQANRIYYNPEQDWEFSAALTHEWRIMRSYDNAFTQRFVAEAGNYWQKGYGSDTVWTFTLEHEWQLTPRASFRYGASWGGRVYDGDREHLQSIFLTFTGLL